MKLPYREGTWFAIPLRQGGYALGLVARARAGGILAYFFGPRRQMLPTIGELRYFRPHEALRVLRVGDLALVKGDWPILGQSESWNRADWLMPVFLRREPFSHRAWRVYRSDADPNIVLHEEPENAASNDLERDALFGATAAEILLTKLLT